MEEGMERGRDPLMFLRYQSSYDFCGHGSQPRGCGTNKRGVA